MRKKRINWVLVEKSVYKFLRQNGFRVTPDRIDEVRQSLALSRLMRRSGSDAWRIAISDVTLWKWLKHSDDSRTLVKGVPLKGGL